MPVFIPTRLVAALTALSFLAPLAAAGETCHYDTWTWNTRSARSDRHQRIVKPRAALTPIERDAATGCTLCEEDQAWVTVPGVARFRVCRAVAPAVERAVRDIVSHGFPIDTVTAYRVGKSKGGVDAAGRRTVFSRHSFGLALDLNADRNGLYDHCETWGPECRLRRGGPWRPGEAGTITAGSAPVAAFERIGWGWGGTLPGAQKDFMHFSSGGEAEGDNGVFTP